MLRKRNRAERGPLLFAVWLVFALAVIVSAIPIVSFFTEEGSVFFTSMGNYLTGAVVSDQGSSEGFVGILADANSSECGTVNSNLTLTSDVTNRSTCFTINASNLVLDCAGYNITYDTSGLGQKYGVFISALSAVRYENITIKNCIITHGSFVDDDSGISIAGMIINSTIYNNTIINHGDDYGIDVNAGLYINVSNNNITSNGSAVLLQSFNQSIIRNNIFSSTVTQGAALVFQELSNNINLTGNTFINNDTAETLSAGVLFNTAGYNVRFLENNITTYGNTTHGIHLAGGSYQIIVENNTISTHGLYSPGIVLGNLGGGSTLTAGNHTFINNNITTTSGSEYIKDITPSTTSSTVIYNNSFGQINWTLTNLTTNITLQIGNTIFIQNNLVGLTDNAQALNLDGPATIELRSLQNKVTPALLKDKVRCDNSNACNMSYNTDTGLLVANISSFSNYSASVWCGYINEDTTLSSNINSSRTCLTINTSNIILDCAGYNISYREDGAGYAINNSGGRDNITIKNCGIYAINLTTTSSDAIYFTGSINSTIYNNTIVSSSVGIFFGTSSEYMNITKNNVTSRNSFALQPSSSSFAKVYSNVLLSNGTGAALSVNSGTSSDQFYFNNITSYGDNAVYVQTSNTTFFGNNILVTGSSGNGGFIILGGEADENNISNNVINTTGTDSPGLYLSSSNNNQIIENKIVTNGTSSNALRIDGGSVGSFFINNNLTSSAADEISDAGGNTNNLVYNNSFGLINWSSTDLDTNITLEIGNTLFIQNNLVGLTDNAQALNLDRAARIEIRNLSYSLTPLLFKDGARCDNSNACNISFDATADTLYANISSFSNYTTEGNPNETCATITSSITMVSNVNSSRTCYTIGASDLTLDCAGYTVTYGQTASGYGVNNSGGWDNITVRNCYIKKGSLNNSSNYGVYFVNGTVNNTVINNTVITDGTTDNYGIYFSARSNNSIIDNNTIYTNGSGGSNYGIFIDTFSINNKLGNNTVVTSGGGTKNYGIYFFGEDTTIIRNSISTNGTGNNEGVFANYGNGSAGNNSLLKNNTILTRGTAGANFGVHLEGDVLGNVTILGNFIKTSGSNTNDGIYLFQDVSKITIKNNTIITNGTEGNNEGIELVTATGFGGNLFSDNFILTNGTDNSDGIVFTGPAYERNNTIENNTIFCRARGSDNNCRGIYISSSANNTILNNNITIEGPSSTVVGDNIGVWISASKTNIIRGNSIDVRGSSVSTGIWITSTSNGNVLLNNNMTSTTKDHLIFDDHTGSTSNTLMYNNSFGSINWTLTNLTTNISLQIGATIFLENNTVGLTDNAQALNLDGPASIEIRNISLTTPQLLKDGTRCDNTNACNITYNGSIVFANVSSFSNYTTQETPASSSSSSSSSSSGGGDNPSPPLAEASPEEEEAPEEAPLAPIEAQPLPPAEELVQGESIVQVQEVSISLSNPTSETVTLTPQATVWGSSLPEEEEVEETLKRKYLGLGLSDEEIEKQIRAEIECLRRLEEENIYSLLGKVLSYSKDEFGASGIIPSRERVSCSLLQPKIINDEEITLKPGETIEKVFQVSRGFSTTFRPVRIIFTRNGEEFSSKEIDSYTALLGSAVDIEQEENKMNVYALIPIEDESSDKLDHYTIEFVIDTDHATDFTDEFGVYLIPEKESVILAEQFIYDPTLYSGEKVITARIIHEGKTVAEHRFTADFSTGITGAVAAETSSPIEGSPISGQIISFFTSLFSQKASSAVSIVAIVGQASFTKVATVIKDYSWAWIGLAALTLLVLAGYYSVPLLKNLHQANYEKLMLDQEELAQKNEEGKKLAKLHQEEEKEHLGKFTPWKDNAAVNLNEELRAVKFMMEKIAREEEVIKDKTLHLFARKQSLPPVPKPDNILPEDMLLQSSVGETEVLKEVPKEQKREKQKQMEDPLRDELQSIQQKLGELHHEELIPQRIISLSERLPPAKMAEASSKPEKPFSSAKKKLEVRQPTQKGKEKAAEKKKAEKSDPFQEELSQIEKELGELKKNK